MSTKMLIQFNLIQQTINLVVTLKQPNLVCSYYWVNLKTDKHTASSFTDRGEDDHNRHHHKESFFNVEMIHYQSIWCAGRVAW